jgi:hypothetical protein
MIEILDKYGNNAAVRCPPCGGVFVVSTHLNQKSGRACPICGGSKAIVNGEDITIEVTDPTIKTSIANLEYVTKLGRALAKDIPLLANDSKSNRDWTRAVYDALRKVRDEEEGWDIYPDNRCYAGEYLCDFMLFEKGYGCRIACESQWANWTGKGNQDLHWAFDKLRGVKSDIKLFIFEGSAEHWKKAIDEYLMNNAHVSANEAYVALHWNFETKEFEKSWWKPRIGGIQRGPIAFEKF